LRISNFLLWQIAYAEIWSPRPFGPISTNGIFTTQLLLFRSASDATAAWSRSWSPPLTLENGPGTRNSYDDAMPDDGTKRPSMKRVITAAIAVPIVVIITIFAPHWVFAFVLGLIPPRSLSRNSSRWDLRKEIGRPGRWFLIPAALVTISFIGGLAGW
jgi:hypothetical protein